MGVVEVKPDSKITNIEKLINETDKYLYMAKQKGKNTVCSKYCTGNSPFKS
jgi:PleD family two-component response regulator